MHVRVAPRSRARCLIAGLLACSLCIACNRLADTGSGVSVAWEIDPAPPVAGVATTVTLTVRDAQQQPLRGARLQLEGHMSHPGMTPVVTPLTEQADGTYQAPLQFTMAGDWILVVSGEAPGVGPITRQLEVAGVRPAS